MSDVDTVERVKVALADALGEALDCTRVWAKISPTGDEGGLLCPSCICAALDREGLETTGKFTSGPLSPADTPGPVAEAETYYTKGKDAQWFANLAHDEFATAAIYAAQDLNDSAILGDAESWMPIEAIITEGGTRLREFAPMVQARAKALDDAKWYGAGFMRVLGNGTWDHIDHECISIHAPLDPNPPETDPVAEAAKVLLIAYDKEPLPDAAAQAAHSEIDWCRDKQNTHFLEHPTQTEPAGTSCREDFHDAFRAALRALTKDGETG